MIILILITSSLVHHLFPFRFDGECNNIEKGKNRWGAQVIPLERLVPRNHKKFQMPLHDVEQNIVATIREARGNKDTFVFVPEGVQRSYAYI